MDHMIYTAMSGAKQVMLRQASNNHNLANANTTGFQADLDAFKSMPVYGPGHPSRVFVEDQHVGVDFSKGQIMTTARELDIAVNGDGFLTVQAPDGSEAYTRAGDLRISVGGVLETSSGHAVMGNGGPIAIPPFEKLEIGADGTISIKPLGQSASSLATLDRIKLVNPVPSALAKGEDGLLRTTDGQPAEVDASVSVINGALESSNVNTVDSLVTMIALAREYEMNVKMMKAAEETDSASTSLLRMT